MSLPQLYLEDLVVGQQDRYGAYLVTREEVIEFASRFDPQPFHLDDEVARANPVFKGLSASAVHTLAMASRMLADRAMVTGFRPHAGLGMREFRAIKPVYPGDTLSNRSRITELRVSSSRPDCGVVSFELSVLNQHEEIVLQYVAALLFQRRPAALAESIDSAIENEQGLPT